MKYESLSLATAQTLTHARIAGLAVERGLVEPCSQCGIASIIGAYDRFILVHALNGSTTLDPNPTHLCVAPSLVESIADEVVGTWAP